MLAKKDKQTAEVEYQEKEFVCDDLTSSLITVCPNKFQMRSFSETLKSAPNKNFEIVGQKNSSN